MEKAVVLVVESEALIRISTLHMIEDAGLGAVEASNADEAIGILQNRADIRAVFTDIRIPGSMDGWKLARSIRGRWPPIHLILASALVPDLSELPDNALFIQKPYAAAQVTAALSVLFGRDAALRTIRRHSGRDRVKVA